MEDIFIVILMILWGIFTYALHKKQLTFFKFLFGSIGLFIFFVIYLRNILYTSIVSVLMGILNFIGEITGSFLTFMKASSVTVFHGEDVLSFLVTYECSGVVEFLVFISLLLFFPTYSSYEKGKFLFMGFFYIIGANLIRLLIIIYSAKFFGNETFFMSHMVFGRLIYFGFIIGLYYHVFTKPHVEHARKKGVYAK